MRSPEPRQPPPADSAALADLTIRALRARGASLAQIAHALREAGLPPPDGAAWTTRTVRARLGDCR